MQHTPRLKVAIVGAGLSGLAAAVRFAQLGHTVTVFERRETLSATGGTIMVRCNASKIVKEWGLAPDLEAISDVSASGVYRKAETGDILHQRVPSRYTDHPDWGTFRDKLLQVFYQRAVGLNVDVRFGASIDGVWEDESKAFLRLDNGAVVEVHLVLAADRVMSRLRQWILPESVNIHPRIGSVTVHQVSLPKEVLLQNVSTKDLVDTSNLTVWFGQGSYAVGRYSPTLERYGGLFGVPADDEENPKLWEERGNIDHVRKIFSTYEEPIRHILAVAKTCDRWRLAEMPDLPKWSSSRGRLLLLGDSAHAMLPDAAQGFSQIVEDIQVLSLLLKRYNDMPQVCQLWEKIRIPRTTRIKDFARSNHSSYREGGAAMLKQAAGKASVGQSSEGGDPVKPDRDAAFNSHAFNAWVYAYDAADEIDRAVKNVEGWDLL